MAWYYGTHVCGHEGRTNVIGPHKNRQWHVDRFFERDCEACYNKKREEEKNKANAEALIKTEEYELPALIGTEKQIAWANTLRIKMIEDLSSIDRHLIEGYVEEAYIDDALNKFMQHQTKASFFIDCRNLSKSSLLDELGTFYANHKKKEEDERLLSTTESLLTPSETKYEGIVIIKHIGERIIVEYEKNADLSELLRKLKYKRKVHDWQLKLTESMVSAEERIAELGCLLLEHGFALSIQDQDARQKILQRDFKPSFDRWLSYEPHSITNKPMLALNWNGFNDKLYTQAKKLTDAKWDSPYMMIDISHYNEVLDFAKAYNFGISKVALEQITYYQKSKTKTGAGT